MHGTSTQDDEAAAASADEARARATNRLEAWFIIAVGIGSAALAVFLRRHG